MTTQKEPQESNIAVVVRIRPRTLKEVKENGVVCITTNGVRGKDVNIRTGLNESSTKTYSFDKVLGPEASQQMVFDEVVEPMLKEVLLGYNCTIFAYGQTGTGKTYTMEGDLKREKSEHAGIIPRTLWSLFETLDKTAGEWSVRVSCMELYQEELKDLLSPDEENSKKLKLFEDGSKKGSIVVQGLEETLVKNVYDVMATLQKSSYRRQTAATKLNEASSRSHCVFSITARIRETNPDGEELVKVGKLNLVDLAGSENIGRSGAENRRAREAGAINQSLLTLGRVINALVERSPHVPYRESKLTRLLQDSLGGKTKTCIIAAVSPAKCNIDESASTLDYAHRAKNIRNRPEINQKMTKRFLLREYEEQIERLKLDLLATREKNGVYMNYSNYENMTTQYETLKSSTDDLMRSLEQKTEMISSLNKKADELSRNIASKEQELNEKKDAISQHKMQLDRILKEKADIEKLCEEKDIIIRSHQITEESLNKTANSLLESCSSSNQEISTLREKLATKRIMETKNAELFDNLRDSIISKLDIIFNSIDSFKDDSGKIHKNIMGSINRFTREYYQKVEDDDNFLKDKAKALNEKFNSFAQSFANNSENILPIIDNIGAEVKNVTEALRNRCDNFETEKGKFAERIYCCLKEEAEDIVQAQGEIKTKVAELFDQLRIGLSSSIATGIDQLQDLVQQQQTEVERVTKERKDFEEYLSQNKFVIEQESNKLIDQIGALTKEYTGEIFKSFGDTCARMDSTTANRLSSIRKNCDSTEKIIRKSKADLGAMEALVENDMSEITGIFNDLNKQFDTYIGNATKKQRREINTESNRDKECCELLIEKLNSSKENLLKANTLEKDSVPAIKNILQDGRFFLDNTVSEFSDKLSKAREDYRSSLSCWVDKTMNLRSISVKTLEEFSDNLSKIKNSVGSSHPIMDQSQGRTPKSLSKSSYKRDWELTNPRDHMFKENCENSTQKPKVDTNHAESSPKFSDGTQMVVNVLNE